MRKPWWNYTVQEIKASTVPECRTVSAGEFWYGRWDCANTRDPDSAVGGPARGGVCTRARLQRPRVRKDSWMQMHGSLSYSCRRTLTWKTFHVAWRTCINHIHIFWGRFLSFFLSAKASRRGRHVPTAQEAFTSSLRSQWNVSHSVTSWWNSLRAAGTDHRAAELTICGAVY